MLLLGGLLSGPGAPEDGVVGDELLDGIVGDQAHVLGGRGRGHRISVARIFCRAEALWACLSARIRAVLLGFGGRVRPRPERVDREVWGHLPTLTQPGSDLSHVPDAGEPGRCRRRFGCCTATWQASCTMRSTMRPICSLVSARSDGSAL